MLASINCRNLIASFETLQLQAYLCPSGIPTIGYGHTRGVTHEDVANGRTITAGEAEYILDNDLSEFSRDVSRFVHTPLTQNQFDALVSFAFNCKGWAQSTLVRKLNAEDHSAAAEFDRWIYGKKDGQPIKLAGLVRRRVAERALFEARA